MIVATVGVKDIPPVVVRKKLTKKGDLSMPDIQVYEEPEIKIYKDVDSMTTVFNKAIKQTVANAIRIMWMLGGQVSKSVTESCYGDNAVTKISENMNISERTLYGYKNLYERVDWDTMKNVIIPANIAFRNVEKILRLPEGERQEVLEKAKELSPKELTQLLAKTEEPEDDDIIDVATQYEKDTEEEVDVKPGKPKDPGKELLKGLASMHPLLEKTVEKIDDTMTRLDNDLDTAAGDADLYEKIQDEMKSVKRTFENLVQSLQDYIKGIGKKL